MTISQISDKRQQMVSKHFNRPEQALKSWQTLVGDGLSNKSWEVLAADQIMSGYCAWASAHNCAQLSFMWNFIASPCFRSAAPLVELKRFFQGLVRLISWVHSASCSSRWLSHLTQFESHQTVCGWRIWAFFRSGADVSYHLCTSFPSSHM